MSYNACPLKSRAPGNSQELRDLFGKLGFFDDEDRTPEAAAAFLKQQSEQFAKMAKAADLKPE